MMLQENELVMVILGLGTLLFIFLNYQQLQRLPASRILLSSFCVLCLGFIFTVLEGFFLNELFNFLEHFLYPVSSILLAVWCWKTLWQPQKR